MANIKTSYSTVQMQVAGFFSLKLQCLSNDYSGQKTNVWLERLAMRELRPEHSHQLIEEKKSLDTAPPSYHVRRH